MKHSRVSAEDIEMVKRLLDENSPVIGGPPYHLEEKIGLKAFLLLKFTEKDQFIGFIEAEINESEARITCLAVEHEFRHKGFGLEIIKTALQELKSRQVERVFLFVNSSNIAAKGLYEKAGFGFVGLFQDNETGESVEEMEIEFEGPAPSYVS
ncbi:MAG: GNAT family N-acetyltransferase [Candidatus Diapherotrites archaeon]